MSRAEQNVRLRTVMTVALYLVLLALVMGGCMREKEVEYSLGREEQFFQPQREMNLDAILKSLAPYPVENLDFSPVLWSQRDFFDLIVSQVAEEVTLGARISSVFFATQCENASLGPQSFSIVLYRIGEYENQGMRIETYARVEAQAGHIEIIRTGFKPPQPPELEVGELDSLDSKISGEMILSSAERAGGKEFRESISNDCRITGVLSGNEWSVFYRFSEDDSKRLLFSFNATNGEIVEVGNPSATLTP